METLARRAQALALPTGGSPNVVLVGAHAAYAGLGYEQLPDQPPQIGPLGGLHALLLAARERGASHVVTLACDLPFLSAATLQALVDAAPEAALVAPRGTRWELLCARWRVQEALPVVADAIAAQRHALQPLAAALGAVALPLHGDLIDWDSEDDRQRAQRQGPEPS